MIYQSSWYLSMDGAFPDGRTLVFVEVSAPCQRFLQAPGRVSSPGPGSGADGCGCPGVAGRQWWVTVGDEKYRGGT